MKVLLWILLAVNTAALAINSNLGKINLEIINGVAVLAVLMGLYKEYEE